MSLPHINFLHLTVSEIHPGQEFIGQGHYGKVKSWSDHNVAHLHSLTNVPTKYQLPTPYAGIPVNFNGKKVFLKGYFRRKKGFKSEKKRFFPRLILHSRCFEKQF